MDVVRIVFYSQQLLCQHVQWTLTVMSSIRSSVFTVFNTLAFWQVWLYKDTWSLFDYRVQSLSLICGFSHWLSDPMRWWAATALLLHGALLNGTILLCLPRALRMNSTWVQFALYNRNQNNSFKSLCYIIINQANMKLRTTPWARSSCFFLARFWCSDTSRRKEILDRRGQFDTLG